MYMYICSSPLPSTAAGSRRAAPASPAAYVCIYIYIYIFIYLFICFFLEAGTLWCSHFWNILC